MAIIMAIPIAVIKIKATQILQIGTDYIKCIKY